MLKVHFTYRRLHGHQNSGGLQLEMAHDPH